MGQSFAHSYLYRVKIWLPFFLCGLHEGNMLLDSPLLIYMLVRLEFHDPPEEGYNLGINGRFLFLFDSTLCDYCPLRVDGEMMEL